MVEHPHTLRWAVRSIHHGGPIELFLVPANVSKISIVANRIAEFRMSDLIVLSYITVKNERCPSFMYVCMYSCVHVCMHACRYGCRMYVCIGVVSKRFISFAK